MKKNTNKDIKRIKQIMFGKKNDDEDLDDGEAIELEFSEDDDTTDTSSTGAGPSKGYPTVTKWESGRTLGPTYKGPNAKWESGLTRGKANTLI